MTVYAFVDLDDTLFNSDRKAGTDRSRPVAVDRDGSNLSFQTDRQQRFVSHVLGNGAVVIPTTGRNEAAYRRVTMALPARHAICSFGGLLLEDGRPEAAWHTYAAACAAQGAKTLAMLTEAVDRSAAGLQADVRRSVVKDAGLDLYLSVKHNARDEASLAAVAAEVSGLLPDGWYHHLNGNNLAFMPRWLGKEHAVAWFLEYKAADPSLVLGIGDSFTDLAFMGLCDYAIVPTRHSQVFDALKGYMR